MNIAIGLSGGVDSSVAALLLKEQGHKVTGITMRLWDGRYKGGDKSACFGPAQEESITLAEAFAKTIGIDYRVYDCSGEYDRVIVSNFRDTYLKGETPNPCVMCNAIMKFGLLPDLAERGGLEFDAFATGHYARIYKGGNGRYAIQRALDERKDQSYFLYRLSQKQLARHVFPLGGMYKSEVREIAKERGLLTAERPDSQDFYSGEISELIGHESHDGDIVNTEGKVVGRHKGYWHYTIGQRKGLCIGGAGEPYYVVDLDAAKNEVIVGRVNETVDTELTFTNPNYQALSEDEANFEEQECRIKIRSAGVPKGPAFVKGDNARFPNGLSAVAPGQSAVFYGSNDEILMGGIIAPVA